MIVEPVPTGSPSGPRRALARAAVLVPLVLLGVVVGVAVAGRATPPPQPAAADVQPVPSATPRPPARAVAHRGDPDFPARPRRAPFPVSIDGIPVQTIPGVLASIAVGDMGGVIAVEGYLGIPNPSTTCGDGVDPLGPLCDRPALFAESAWTLWGSDGFSGIGPHLHAHVPYGVPLPLEIRGTTAAAGGVPFSAVIVGRLGAVPPGGCDPAVVDCAVRFEVDGVVWVSGNAQAVQPFIGPAIDGLPREWVVRNRPAAEALAVGPSGIVLQAALVRPATLRSMDPAAARIVRRQSPPGLVWYVRGLRAVVTPKQAQAPQLVWAVVDNVTMRVLAAGVAAGPGSDQAR